MLAVILGAVTTAQSFAASGAPASTSLPQISGTTQVGQTLTVSTGSWSGTPTSYSYAWQYSRDQGSTWLDVRGATIATFNEDSTFQGTLIRARVSATNSAGSTTVATTSTGPLGTPSATPPPPPSTAPASTSKPQISGTTQVGQTLTVSTGSWSGTPTSYSYAWQRCDALGQSCAALPGATGPSFVLGAADVGWRLRTTVTATNSAGSAPATSLASAVVQTVAPAPPPVPVPASVFPFGSWEGATKTSEFQDSTCHSDKIVWQSTTVREGTKAATWSADPTVHCYNNNANVRIHMLGWPSGTGVNMNVGATYWFTTSVYFPVTAAIPGSGWFALSEVHEASNTGCNGSAPFNLDASAGSWRLIVRGYGSCNGSPTFDQTTWGSPVTDDGSTRRSYPFANNVPYTIQKGQWYDFMFGFHVATDKTGWFEAWLNGPGTNGKSVQIANRISLPTSYPATNYPMLSVYYPAAGNGSTQVVYDGVAFSSDYSALKNWQDTFTHSW